MQRNRVFIWGMSAVALAFGSILAGCSSLTNNGGGETRQKMQGEK